MNAPVLRPDFSTASAITNGTTAVLAAVPNSTEGLSLVTAAIFGTGASLPTALSINNGFNIGPNAASHGNTSRVSIAQKSATASEGSTTWSGSSSRRAAIQFAVAGASGPAAITAGSFSTAGTHGLPPVTTSRNNSLIIYVAFARSAANTSFLITSQDPSLTLLSAVNFPSNTGSPSLGIVVFSRSASTAETYGSVSFTWSTAGASPLGIQSYALVFEPSAGGVSAIATLDTTPELSASVAVGTSAIATIDTTPELTASVVVGVNAIANLETTPELTASVVVGDSGPGSVDAIATLETTPELTASVAVIATAIANLATTPELTASVVVSTSAIATLATTPGLSALVELGAISPDWLALGTITPVINQWTPFEIESNGGASFRLVFANLGGVTIFRSHGVIRPVWDVAGSEVKGIGVRVFPTAEETLLSFPEPSDLVLKGAIRRFEVRKYLEQGHSSAESEWSCTLYDLVNQ